MQLKNYNVFHGPLCYTHGIKTLLYILLKLFFMAVASSKGAVWKRFHLSFVSYVYCALSSLTCLT